MVTSRRGEERWKSLKTVVGCQSANMIEGRETVLSGLHCNLFIGKHLIILKDNVQWRINYSEVSS